MAALQSVEQKRRWAEIHGILADLCKNPDRLDAITDLVYRLIWHD